MGSPVYMHPSRWILIVEDDESLSKEIAEVLEGYRSQVVTKASEAIVKLKNQKFDCILIDMKLDGGDGEQVIQYIRANKGFNRDSPIIIMSGRLDDQIIKRVGKAVNGILTKPFDIKDLMQKITATVDTPRFRPQI